MLAAGWLYIFKEQNCQLFFGFHKGGQTNQQTHVVFTSTSLKYVFVITILCKNNVAQTWIEMTTNG